jgi:putative FmdB family regulatory protein
MAQYNFVCNDCNQVFEIAASFSTISFVKCCCPNCHSDNIQRKYNPFSFILKGKGFYKTDNEKAKKE